MAQLTLRSTRDSALTWEEGDANLLALDSDSPWKVSENHITYDGKVGIAVDSTYSPVYDLDFGNGDSATVGITNGDLEVHIDGPNELQVWNNTVQSITVKTTGKVGINDSDPSELLTVGGNLLVSDTALANVVSANSITDGVSTLSGGKLLQISEVSGPDDMQVQFGSRGLYARRDGHRIYGWDQSLTTDSYSVPTSFAVKLALNGLTSDLGQVQDSFQNIMIGLLDSLENSLDLQKVTENGDSTTTGAFFSGTVNASGAVFESSTLAWNSTRTNNAIKATSNATSNYQNTLAHTDNGLEFQSNSNSRGWLFENANGRSLTINSVGNASFSGEVHTSQEFQSGATWANNASASMRLSGVNGLFTKNPGVNHLTCYSGGTSNANVVASISKEGNATFSGTVNAGPDIFINAPAGGVTNPRLRYTGVPNSVDNGFCIRDDDVNVDRMRINMNGDTFFSGNVAVGGNVDCANLYATGVLGSSVYPIASGYFSGVVEAAYFKGVGLVSSQANSGIALATDGTLRPTNNTLTQNDGVMDIGSVASRFRDAHFSGTVNANNIKGEGDRAGFLFDGAKRIIPTENGSASNAKQDLGSTANKFKDAYFSGTVNANQASLGNGSALAANGVMLKNTTGDAGFLLTNSGDQFVPIVADAIDFGMTGREWREAYFSGTVRAADFRKASAGGIGFSPNHLLPIDQSGSITSKQLNLGSEANPFRDGHFAERVYTKNITVGDATTSSVSIETSLSGGAGPKLQFNHYYGSPDEAYISAVKRGGGAGVSLGHGAGTRWKDAFFTGQVVCGAVLSTGDVTAFHTSDERLKENIKPLENALDKVSQINGVEFDWKELSDKERETIHGEGHDVGVIAQQVERVLPEIVAERDNGYKAVKYDRLTALLIEAVKELSARVKELESK